MPGVPLRWVAVAAIATLVACSGPKVRILSSPLEGSPSYVRKALVERSEAVLKQEELSKAYRRNPDEAIRVLYHRYRTEGGPVRLRAAAELCGTQGVIREKKGETLAAAGCYLDAARLARNEALRGNDDMRLVYNASCSSLAWVLHRDDLLQGPSFEVSGPLGKQQLTLRRSGDGVIAPSDFDELIPADRLEITNLKLTRHHQDGVGGAMVAHRARRESVKHDQFMSAAGYGLPVNAMLDFPSTGKARLVVRNVLKVDQVRIAGRSTPLAADWSASLGYLYRYAPPPSVGIKGLLHPEEYAAQTNLYAVQPFDPDKIPVILVHGLMSSPHTWLEMINTLRTDPVLRRNYQAVFFRYPTGYTPSRNAASLRKALREFRATYDSPRSRPQLRRMILVGHSMGGILSNLQIRESGDTYTDLYFHKPLKALNLPPKGQERLKELLVFSPDPAVERAIFIAAPHRGSEMAMGKIGELGMRLVKLPSGFLQIGSSRAELLKMDGLSEVGREELRYEPSSIRHLRPDSAFLKATLTLPVAKRVVYHSIIGRADPKDAIKESSDKVVPYWSSHLDGAASEDVVHATHTTITANPEAMEAVRRILYLHIGRRSSGQLPALDPRPGQ